MTFFSTVLLNLILALNCFGATKGPESVESKDKIASDIYAESYTDPLRKDVNHFQRLRFEFRRWQVLNWNPYVGAENFQNDLNDNPVLETGFRRTFANNLTASVAVRREQIDENEELSFWSSRLGLVYGGFWDLPIKNVYADAYAEVFLVKPEAFHEYSLIAGWVKTGYRAYAKNNFGFDPLVASVRYYENSYHEVAGHDYLTFLVGMQAIMYLEKPKVSASLLASRAWTDSRTGEVDNDYWVILALGFNW